MSAVPLERPDASLREAFYRRIDSVNMTPLWEVLHALVPPEPAIVALPALWRWNEVRPFLM